LEKGGVLLKPGTLRDALEKTTTAALACGALRPIETEQLLVDDSGVRFLVRVVSSLERKAADRRRLESGAPGKAKPANPFLPPESELTVTEVSPRHLAVLNKFNVLPLHLLLVTRAFEHQETLLSIDDLRALFACMAEYESLGFYNGGVVAGASQPHKHLQLVPLPLDRQGPALPMLPLLTGAGPTCTALPFAHAFGRLPAPASSGLTSLAEEAFGLYLRLLGRVGIRGVPAGAGTRQSAPYNLLVAGDWMLLVPRPEECYRGISVNALGFAGSLFVKDREQLDLVRAHGPMRILTAVSRAREQFS
jgi:ATP adenylyltransferase